MSEHDSDKEFEEYLARRSGGRGRLAAHDDLEPPRELDRIVLAKAREAIEMPRQVPVYAGARWALPVALAATLVLSFAILLHFGRAQRAMPVASAPPAPAQMQRAKPEADTASVKVLSTEESVPRAATLEKRERFEAQPARKATDAANGIASISQMRPAPAATTAAKPDPEEWLKRIEALRNAGKTAEADRELEEFRKAWPDYPLPSASSR